MIVDSHHHLMDPARIDYRVLPYLPELNRLLGPDEFAPLLAEAGVSRTVVVQAEDVETETDHLIDLANQTDWIAGVVGWVPLADPEATGKALDRTRGGPVVGYRHGIFWEADPSWIFRETVVESLGLVAAEGLTYDLTPMAARHWDAVPMLAERLPELRLVVDHMGHPRIKDGEWEPWATNLARAAEHPGCWLKLSAMDMSTGSAGRRRLPSLLRPRPRALRTGPHALGQQLAGFPEIAGISRAAGHRMHVDRRLQRRGAGRHPRRHGHARLPALIQPGSTIADRSCRERKVRCRLPWNERTIPDLDYVPIPKERYTSTDWAALEWEHMWTKTWLCAGRVSDLSRAGDYFTFEIGPESILVIKQRDGSISARLQRLHAPR